MTLLQSNNPTECHKHISAHTVEDGTELTLLTSVASCNRHVDSSFSADFLVLVQSNRIGSSFLRLGVWVWGPINVGSALDLDKGGQL